MTESRRERIGAIAWNLNGIVGGRVPSRKNTVCAAGARRWMPCSYTDWSQLVIRCSDEMSLAPNGGGRPTTASATSSRALQP